MTRVSFGWCQPSRLTLAAAFAPVRIFSAAGQVVLAPGESADLPGGTALAAADVPGFEVLRREVELPDTGYQAIEFDAADLVPQPPGCGPAGHDEPGELKLPTIAVRAQPWAPATSAELPAAVRLRLSRNDDGFAIQRDSGSALPISMQISTRQTPRRMLAVPPVARAESYEVRWLAPEASGPRPRVEPGDPVGLLIMEYLLTGQHALAAATARAAERYRGGLSALNWSAPSFTQLLIGYAFALGNDYERLAAWCRRTEPARTMGTDGIVLAAEEAWQRGDPAACAALLAGSAGLPPPTLSGGAETGLRLMTLLLVRLSGPARDISGHDPAADAAATDTTDGISGTAAGDLIRALVRLRGEWLDLLTRTDPVAATISVPQTNDSRIDLAAASRAARARGSIRYALSTWRYQGHLRPAAAASGEPTSKGASIMTVAQEPQHPTTPKISTGKQARPQTLATSAAVVTILIFVGFSAYLLSQASIASNTGWTRIAYVFGTIQSLVAAAAGALWGSAVKQGQVSHADQRATQAETVANQNRDDAMKGRALAATLQAAAVPPTRQAPGGLPEMSADGPQPQPDLTQLRHAELARSLFGNLVQPPMS